MANAQTTESPESLLKRVTDRVDELLKADPPKLFAWHLRSVKALVQTEYAKLALNVPQSESRSVEVRSKEFVEAVSRMAEGLEKDAADPDDYLKNGRRSLVLARPSGIDGTLQWTMVGLPKGWDPNRAYPLFANLHGTGPDYPLAYPSYAFSPLVPPRLDTNPMPDMIWL
ncbi:hypothetical protein EON81_01005, partial [bacterium]